ncbi:MAG: hypothetical protein WAW11_04935 [Patescibacteria group bacterium]
MNFKNQNPFRYRVTGVGLYFSLQTYDGDEITESRNLEDIAQAIFEDQEILMSYEEGQIDFSDVENCIEDIQGLIRDFKFAENYEASED